MRSPPIRPAKRYMELHASVEHEDMTTIPAIFVNMTKYVRVEDLSERLLKEIGAPKMPGETHTQRMERFIGLARKNRMLIFLDEFHDCADTSGKGKPFLRLIKNLLLEGLLVIPMGTEELAAVLADDPQLASRLNFATGRLPRVDNVETLKALMLKVIGQPESEISDAAIKYVQEESKGVLGHVLDLTEGTFVAHHDLQLASLKQYRLKMDVLDSVA
jgi:Bacterial TniB protein